MTVIPFAQAASTTAADLVEESGPQSGKPIGRYFTYQFHSPLHHPDQYTMEPEMNGEIVRATSGDLKDGLITVQRLDEYGQSLGVYIALTRELTLLEESPEFKLPATIADVLTPAERLALESYG